MPRKKKLTPEEEEDEQFRREWRAMSNQQRADLLRKQYEALTRNDREYAKAVGATDEELTRLKGELDSFQQWADYERFVYSHLDRDLVADAKAVKLFENTKDPRDRSDEPPPPEHLRDKVDLLWPFDTE